MSLKDLREHLRDNVYYNDDYIAEAVTYKPKSGVEQTFNAIPNISSTNSGFDLGSEQRKRSGTFSIPKNKIEKPVRGDRILFDSSDFLVTGIDTENDLNTIVSAEEQEQKSSGGIIKE